MSWKRPVTCGRMASRSNAPTSKATIGNYFEDLTTGLEIEHSVPRTVTEGDQSLYIALTADRYPLHCDAEFARSLGFRRELVDDLLVFHTVFGKSVPDISHNATANLGYADVRFMRPVYPGDTLRLQQVLPWPLQQQLRHQIHLPSS